MVACEVALCKARCQKAWEGGARDRRRSVPDQRPQRNVTSVTHVCQIYCTNQCVCVCVCVWVGVGVGVCLRVSLVCTYNILCPHMSKPGRADCDVDNLDFACLPTCPLQSPPPPRTASTNRFCLQSCKRAPLHQCRGSWPTTVGAEHPPQYLYVPSKILAGCFLSDRPRHAHIRQKKLFEGVYKRLQPLNRFLLRRRPFSLGLVASEPSPEPCHLSSSQLLANRPRQALLTPTTHARS